MEPVAQEILFATTRGSSSNVNVEIRPTSKFGHGFWKKRLNLHLIGNCMIDEFFVRIFRN